MRVPSPSGRIYACARRITMNLRYAFKGARSLLIFIRRSVLVNIIMRL